jgi:hypothetical protein
MLLDFTNPVLDPRITFSRGTGATLVDSTGRITYAPNNLVQRSEEFTNAYWIKLDVTATADVTTAPNGTATADKFIATNTASTRRLLYANATLSAGLSIFSFYAKAAEYSLVRTVDSAGGSRWFASFDLTSGTVVGGTTGGAQFVSASISAVGDGWYRCWVVFNAAAGAGAIGMVGYPAGATLDQFGVLYAGNGVSGTFFWGAQLEQVTYQTTPGTYNATTSAAYYGPRFDYDPVTLAPRGLLIEEARTNLLTYSEQFDNAAWVKQNTTVTANATASPDGTTNADTVVSNATSGRHTIDNTVAGAAAGATYTVSIYVKKGTQRYCIFGDAGDSLWRLITFDFDTQTITGTTNVTSSSATAAGNGWFRLIVTATRAVIGNYQIFVGFSNASTNALPPTYVGSTSDTFYAYGAQLEAGAFATSYIPTVASTVSRSADVATMTGTNFSTWYNQSEGTFVVASAPYSAGNFTSASATDGSTNNRVQVTSSNTIQFLVGTGGVVQAILDAGTVNGGATNLTAGAYRINDFAASINGSAVATDTSGTIPTVTRLDVGNLSGFAEFLNGHIRAIAYYNTRLPNTQLQTLTAPSLASPLALDFISPTYTVGY